VDSDEHRRTMGCRGKPSPAQKGTNELPLHNSGRQCQAGTNEGPDQMPIALWRTPGLRRF
jgi:hypothetical protein